MKTADILERLRSLCHRGTIIDSQIADLIYDIECGQYQGDLNATERGLVDDKRPIDAIVAYRKRVPCDLMTARGVVVAYRDWLDRQ